MVDDFAILMTSIRDMGNDNDQAVICKGIPFSNIRKQRKEFHEPPSVDTIIFA